MRRKNVLPIIVIRPERLSFSCFNLTSIKNKMTGPEEIVVSTQSQNCKKEDPQMTLHFWVGQ